MSGFFKLFSNDPSWSGFTALNHYFETQPLPHIGAWYAHQLLDWLLWFAPTQHPVHMVWFNQFMKKPQQGSPGVIGLLAKKPFPLEPPRYLRVLVYRYTFLNWKEKSQNGNWWRIEYLGEFPRVEPRRP
jgi:hypothetical protein